MVGKKSVKYPLGTFPILRTPRALRLDSQAQTKENTVESLLYVLAAASIAALAAGRRRAAMGLLAAGTLLLVLFAFLVGYFGLLPAVSY